MVHSLSDKAAVTAACQQMGTESEAENTKCYFREWLGFNVGFLACQGESPKSPVFESAGKIVSEISSFSSSVECN